MTNKEILNRFAEYTDYDSEQRSFNLNSCNYSFHQAGKLIEKLLAGFDRDGSLSVLYAKFTFLGCMTDTRIRVIDVLQNPSFLAEEIEMYKLFFSEDVRKIEEAYMNIIYGAYYRIMEGKCIGKSDFKMDVIMSSVKGVIQGLDKLHLDIYKKGGVPKKITNISTKIYVFELLSQAVMVVEKAEDGIYLCFINAYGSADCYFAFICKSNGTIWSHHDRINEAYIGQHGNLRNARWTEGKADSIFPYDNDKIFEYSEHDYKGYATKYDIDKNKLNYCELGEETFVPIIMAMLLISNRYDGTMPEGDIRYMSGLILPVEEVKGVYELATVGTSEVAEMNRKIDISYDMKAILDGSYAQEFKPKSSEEKNKEKWYESHMWNEYEEATFNNYNQGLVDRYGTDFKPDLSELFRQTLPAIEGDKKSTSVEFVGSEKRFRIQVHFEIRKQLAEHIKKKMEEEYNAFGRKEGLSEYYYTALHKNLDGIIKLILRNVDLSKVNGKAGTVKYLDCDGKEREIEIICRSDKEISTFRGLMNTQETHEHWVRKDDLNNKTANLFYEFDVKDGYDIAFLTGISYAELPGFVQCFRKERLYNGNSILNIVDPVSEIEFPIEDKFGVKFLYECQLGFSRSGLKKRIKEYQQAHS